MATTVLSYYKHKLLFAAFWVSWTIIHAWILTGWHYSNKDALTDSLFSNALLALAVIIFTFALHFYFPRKKRISHLFLLWVEFVIAWSVIVWFSMPVLLPEMDVKAFQQSFPVRVAVAALITGCAALINLSWYTQAEQKQQEQLVLDSERTMREAELFKLRQQLQPHFLFNSLNSIHALLINQPVEARKMLLQLSEYLRGTLKKEEQQQTTLAEEIAYLKLYLEIEQVRFGHRLQVDLNVSKDAAQCSIPVLLLQPVIENAIKFGLYDTIGQVKITLTAIREKNGLLIKIENPYEQTALTQKGTGFGLSSIKKRLQLLFGRNDLLETNARETEFCTTLKIPQA